MKSCEIAIVGQGIMGRAALYYLRQRGVDAVAFDPLMKGSSHGSCRAFRLSNFEGGYDELSQISATGWQDLAIAFGQPLMLPTKVLEAGRPGSELVRDSLAAATDGSVSLTGAEINERFPAFHVPDDWSAALHGGGGILLAKLAMDAFRRDVPKESIVDKAARFEATASEIILTAADGERCSAKKVIVAAGPWVVDHVPKLAPYINVTRQVVGWYQPAAPSKVVYDEEDGRFPIFILDTGHSVVYGFPDFEKRGVKVAAHNHGKSVADLSRPADPATDAELKPVTDVLGEFVSAAAGVIREREVCFYTNTAPGDAGEGSSKEEFIIDRLPTDRRVIVASPCSGHGFKFAPAIGQILARMASDDHFNPNPRFSLRRFKTFA